MEGKVMDVENRPSNASEPLVRVTRARAKALSSSNGLPPLYPSKHDNKQKLRRDCKRAATNSAADHGRQKKRVILKDMTNVTCNKLSMNLGNAAKMPPAKQGCRNSLQKKGRPACFRFAKAAEIPGPRRQRELEQIKKSEGSLENSSTTNSTHDFESITLMMPTIAIIPSNAYAKHGNRWMMLENVEDRGIIDIDKRSNNPQMCSQYAAEMYNNIFAKEVDQRPLTDYMEKLQRDITKTMRSILIDWLVEVSEEYRLVPDTLYLTVNLIDRYLSKNYMEKQKLQLLGVTCMFISSKYEEICAPRVEEFCFITDSTYSKEEVLNMERQVLNFVRFQLSVPTTKKFLRRFIQAAQASYEVPSVELEFLANYLAELTLLEYRFLKFLPSLCAASAVFLARWTLDQSDHPWNTTLEFYSGYKTNELQSAVLELQDLQLNTNKCTLNAIREKYKQPKFKEVSTLKSSQPVQSLFQS